MRSNWSSDAVNKPKNRAFEVCLSKPPYFVNYQLPENILTNLCRTHNVERIFFDGGTYLVSTNRGNQKANTPPMDHTQRWLRNISNREIFLFPGDLNSVCGWQKSDWQQHTSGLVMTYPIARLILPGEVLACGELVINRCLLSSSLLVILCCVHTRSFTTWSMW
mgnify:FL=1